MSPGCVHATARWTTIYSSTASNSTNSGSRYEPPPCDNWAAICRCENTFGESLIEMTLQGQHLYIHPSHVARFFAHLDMVMTLDEKHEAYDVMRMLRHA
jgi:hypothetical protein